MGRPVDLTCIYVKDEGPHTDCCLTVEVVNLAEVILTIRNDLVPNGTTIVVHLSDLRWALRG